MNSDFKDLLSIFIENKVKFLVIGGYAVMKHTEPRYTKDLDLLILPSAENSSAVMKSLKEFGAPLFGLSENDLQTPGLFFQIGAIPNRIDIIVQVPGIDFAAAYQRRDTVMIDSIPVPFISLNDLISTKLAAGRPQDLVDAGALAKKLHKSSIL